MGAGVSDNDIVGDILNRVELAVRGWMEGENSFEQATINAIAAQIRAQERPARQHWHGAEAPYVALKPRHLPEKKRAAMEEVNRTGRVAETASRHGISRTAMYRMLKK